METETGLKRRREKSRIGPVPRRPFWPGCLAWMCMHLHVCLFMCVRWLWKRVGVIVRAISRAAFRLAMCPRWQRTNCFNCAMASPTNQGCVSVCVHFPLSLSAHFPCFLSLREHGDIIKRCDKEKQVTWTTATLQKARWRVYNRTSGAAKTLASYLCFYSQ